MRTKTEEETIYDLASDCGVDGEVIVALMEFTGLSADEVDEGHLDEHYVGEASVRDYACEVVDEHCGHDDWLRMYVDVDLIAIDMETEGYRSIDGHLFRP